MIGEPIETTEERSLLADPELGKKIVDVLVERQAEDVLLLDISKVCDFADYFVIASGQNVRHLQTLKSTLDSDFARAETGAFHEEGTPDSGWILMDYGDVIVHLFSEAQRDYYNLENLWRSGTQVVRVQ
ncbi:MAG: ribosome silencing factor [Dehalococcoidia bacterium]|nr:ribosome silencing factor [Dehalococcoidia bacterium]